MKKISASSLSLNSELLELINDVAERIQAYQKDNEFSPKTATKLALLALNQIETEEQLLVVDRLLRHKHFHEVVQLGANHYNIRLRYNREQIFQLSESEFEAVKEFVCEKIYFHSDLDKARHQKKSRQIQQILKNIQYLRLPTLHELNERKVKLEQKLATVDQSNLFLIKSIRAAIAKIAEELKVLEEIGQEKHLSAKPQPKHPDVTKAA